MVCGKGRKCVITLARPTTFKGKCTSRRRRKSRRRNTVRTVHVLYAFIFIAKRGKNASLGPSLALSIVDSRLAGARKEGKKHCYNKS